MFWQAGRCSGQHCWLTARCSRHRENKTLTLSGFCIITIIIVFFAVSFIPGNNADYSYAVGNALCLNALDWSEVFSTNLWNFAKDNSKTEAFMRKEKLPNSSCRRQRKRSLFTDENSCGAKVSVVLVARQISWQIISILCPFPCYT